VKKYLPNLSLFLLLLMGLISCVDPYDATFNYDANLLVIDGQITDLPESDTIRLAFSESSRNFTAARGIEGAQVSVQLGSGQRVNLLAGRDGAYYTPPSLRGRVGESYQLFVTLPNGKQYTSTAQRMTAVAPIRRVYDTFEPRGILSADGRTTIPANFVYLDYDDPASERNFYLWRYVHYERQFICLTCNEGRLDRTDGVCVRFPGLPNWDYECSSACWDLFYSSDINIFSDANSNGTQNRGKLIAKVPFYSNDEGALVDIQQMSISSDAYRFYRILESQVENTGGLTDTPPAPIIGNIQNVNNSAEAVVGFFMANSVSRVRYFVNRNNAGGVSPIQILGRRANLEPNFMFRPPRARCTFSINRTPIQPAGWRSKGG
jgi:Domain of unknown function (DUF4249)